MPFLLLPVICCWNWTFCSFPLWATKSYANNSYFYCFGYYWVMFSYQSLFSLFTRSLHFFMILSLWNITATPSWLTFLLCSHQNTACLCAWLVAFSIHATTSFPLSLLTVLRWCFWKVNCCLHHSLQAGYSSAPKGFLACTKPWVWAHRAKITKRFCVAWVWTWVCAWW